MDASEDDGKFKKRPRGRSPAGKEWKDGKWVPIQPDPTFSFEETDSVVSSVEDITDESVQQPTAAPPLAGRGTYVKIKSLGGVNM